VSVTTRASIPDLHLAACSRASAQALRFDSLDDKLTQLPLELCPQGEGEGEGEGRALQPAPPLGQLQRVAAYLRRALQLALFGFDVVVDGGSGELLVIDVNYFPNYRGDAEAGPLLRRCLRAAWEERRRRRRPNAQQRQQQLDQQQQQQQQQQQLGEVR
jgi:hypothetical protein